MHFLGTSHYQCCFNCDGVENDTHVDILVALLWLCVDNYYRARLSMFFILIVVIRITNHSPSFLRFCSIFQISPMYLRARAFGCLLSHLPPLGAPQFPPQLPKNCLLSLTISSPSPSLTILLKKITVTKPATVTATRAIITIIETVCSIE